MLRKDIELSEKALLAARDALGSHNYEVDTSSVPCYQGSQGGDRRTLQECADLQTDEWRNEERRLIDAISLAEARLRSARDALAASEEYREWIMIVAGVEVGTEMAPNSSEALRAASAHIDGSYYEEGHTETQWVGVVVRCDESDEEDREIIAIHPKEPACVPGKLHVWQSPVVVVGGHGEGYPGLWPNGGGVIRREVCAHCGYYRVTNTWAHDPETGELGLRSITYEEPDAASKRWVSYK